MNIRQTNNKNMKRVAAGAGIAAVALFLTAGFITTRGADDQSVADTATVVEVPAPLFTAPAAESPEIVLNDEVVTAPLTATKTETAAKSTTKSTKSSKKTSPAVGSDVVAEAPTNVESNPVVDTTVAQAPAQQNSDATASQPAAEAPATAQPTEQSAAQSTEQPASTSSSSGSTSVSTPQYRIVDNFLADARQVDLTQTTPSIPPCIPGFNC